MVKKVVKKDSKMDNSLVAYILGILSIVLAFFTQGLGGLALGIIGLVFSKKEKSPLSKKARLLNIIGVIISSIIFILILISQIRFIIQTGLS